jgi:hypothetical protein
VAEDVVPEWWKDQDMRQSVHITRPSLTHKNDSGSRPVINGESIAEGNDPPLRPSISSSSGQSQI